MPTQTNLVIQFFLTDKPVNYWRARESIHLRDLARVPVQLPEGVTTDTITSKQLEALIELYGDAVTDAVKNYPGEEGKSHPVVSINLLAILRLGTQVDTPRAQISSGTVMQVVTWRREREMHCEDEDIVMVGIAPYLMRQRRPVWEPEDEILIDSEFAPRNIYATPYDMSLPPTLHECHAGQIEFWLEAT